MRDLGRVLVDTSAWIDFFRRKDPCFSIVLRLMTEERICAAGIIVAELMQGAKTEKEMAVLKDFIHVFDFLPESHVAWQIAGELSFKLRRKGVTVGLADCFIAALSNMHSVSLLTHDAHFDMMKTEAGLDLFPLERQGSDRLNYV